MQNFLAKATVTKSSSYVLTLERNPEDNFQVKASRGGELFKWNSNIAVTLST